MLARWAEPSPVFTHKVRPSPLKCKTEYRYLVLSLREVGEGTADRAVLSILSFIINFIIHQTIAADCSRLLSFGRFAGLKNKNSREERLPQAQKFKEFAATRFTAYAPNFPIGNAVD